MNTKQTILEAAVGLFAAQGFEATTTLQVARKVGVTEPAVFYHFKNKNTLFAAIIESVAAVYLDRLDRLDISGTTTTAAMALENLFRIHFEIVAAEPDAIRILLRTCPARLADEENNCIAVYQKIRARLRQLTTAIIEKGIARGEFRQVDVPATVNTIIALLNGLMQQKLLALVPLTGVETAAIDFCRAGLSSRFFQKGED